MKGFVYESDAGKEPMRIARLLGLMGSNMERKATYLIPDLQRDYVWGPKKIINLIDTLMKGWPFGQILVAQTGKLSPLFAPRAFYSKIVWFGGEPCVQMDADLNCDAATMVLDGQQRLQSLFLALSPCSGGLVMDQRSWIEEINPDNAYYLGWGHRSPAAFLALNVANLASAYDECHDISKIDFSAQAARPVIEWVFDQDIRDSQLYNRRAYLPRFLTTSWGDDNRSDYILLKELWEVDDIGGFLSDRGLGEDFVEAVSVFHERFLQLKEVPVPCLRVLPREESGLSVDEYNEMILTVFTRLNAGGEELTEDEITFSWIKRYWTKQDITADAALKVLKANLSQQGINNKGRDLIRLLSGVWSVFEHDGKPLQASDLLNGQLLKQVAAFLGDNWGIISEQFVHVATLLRKHGLKYGSQFYSLQGFVILSTWMIVGRIWANAKPAGSVADRIRFDSLFASWIGQRVDRFILACQWASSLGNYDAELSALHRSLMDSNSFADAYETMTAWFEKQLGKYVANAKVAVNGLERSTRAGVSAYTTQLWCWQRLDPERARVSEILAQEQGGITAGAPNVDHCVPFAFWEVFVGRFPGSPKGSDVYNEKVAKINQLGNCNVLCKQINCSKNAMPMRAFFERIQLPETDAQSLSVQSELFSPDAEGLTPELILDKVAERTALIRKELCQFLDGSQQYQLHVTV